MSLMLIHLSDMHISNEQAFIPAEKIVAALRGLSEPVEAAAIMVSGDITWSGKSSQYEIATSFLKALITGIQTEYKIDVQTIAVPGNHDCDFPDDSAVRDLVIENMRSAAGKFESLQMLRQCLSVQDSFHEWLAGQANAAEIEEKERLCRTVHFNMPNGQLVAVLCLNTAWMSTIHEEQGRLIFPMLCLPEPPQADLVLGVLHHPYNWFQSTNARELRDTLQSSCDVIITGHEHDPAAYTIIGRDSSAVEYIEGSLYGNPKDRESSGFNLIFINLADSRYQVRNYTWNGSLFSSQSADSDWTDFLRNARRPSAILPLSDSMTKRLRDPGAQFTHHAKDVELEDIFVAPNLRRFTTARGPEGLHREVVESDYVINHIFEDKWVYFSGDNQCGKTALAKILFQQGLNRKLTPVLVEGQHLDSPDPKRITRVIENELPDQYKSTSADTFRQLPKEKKVIIIDDFAKVPLNINGKTLICQWLREQYGYVFVLGTDLTQLEEFIVNRESANALAGYIYYEIMEFGYLLRERLIEKWLTIGNKHTLDPDELAHKIKHAERLTDTILGKNLLPSFPIFVLTILQQIETQQPLNTKTGAYGYFYEVLITSSLHRTSKSIYDIDMKYTYLAELAWHLFNKGQRELDQEELHQFNQNHWRKYRLTGPPESVDLELMDSRILLFHAGMSRFAYSYIYYYFVARYMRDNLSDEDVQKAIDVVVQSLHREDCANVIIFLTYLSKDKTLINRILAATKELFKETEPCDMEMHVEFLNRLQEKVPEIMLPEGDANTNRKELFRERDRADVAKRESEESESSDNESIEDLLGINRALKSIQILGQILRNFSGSLSGDVKVELVKECFATGLRALNVIFNALEKNLEPIVKIFIEAIGKRIEELPEEKRSKIAGELIFFLTEMLCFGMIKRISSAVGSERLIPTYEDVKSVYNNKATEFVQIAIRLDHERNFPEKRVLELKNAIKKNLFGETLLRLLVVDHFYLFPRPFRVRQRVCSQLGIAPQKKMLMTGATRKASA